MAQDYIKTEWVDKKTIIDAEKMNKLEEQIDVLTDDVISISENFDAEAIKSLILTAQTISKKVSDLEVKLHYSNPSTKNEIIEEVNASKSLTKINLKQGKLVKAIKIVDVPENAAKWQNTLSTSYGVDEAGKGTGNSNPASTAPVGTKFEHLGNLDPMLGIQELDKIEDLYSILCDFDFKKAEEAELKVIQQYFPTTAKIEHIKHTINILDSENKKIKTISVDMYNPN